MGRLLIGGCKSLEDGGGMDRGDQGRQESSVSLLYKAGHYWGAFLIRVHVQKLGLHVVSFMRSGVTLKGDSHEEWLGLWGHCPWH